MKFLLIILSLLVFTSASIAQEYSTKNKKAIKLFEQGKNTPSTSIDQQTRTPNYRLGLKYLNQAIEKDPKFWEAHMVAGEFAELIGEYEEAIDHLNKALAINPQRQSTGSTYFYLANMQQAVGQYDDAIRNVDLFQQFRSAHGELIKESHRIKANCIFAKNAIENPQKFNPINIGPGINTAQPEYFPTITVDGKTILFTRRIKDGRVRANIQEQEDFFVSQLSSRNIWQTAVAMPSNINTINNEGAPTLAPDGRSLVFVACPDMVTGENYGENRQGYGSCDLFFTRKLGNRWTNPENVSSNVNSSNWETQPSLSSDGKTMYFIRGIKGRGRQKNPDIYVTRKDENGNWGIAERLPDYINSPMDEESVLIHPDGKTLYFASRGHIGMGGTDLYMCRLNENNEWSKPENLGYPINTKYDENSLMVSPGGEIAFFASDREGGFGGLDIYYFEMPEHLRPTKTLYFDGLVYDINTRKPIPGKFQLVDLATGKEVVYSEADRFTGEFMVSLPTDKQYALNVSYPGYAFFSQNFDMKNPDNLEAIHMDVPLVALSDVGEQSIVLANVFFDLNKSTLRKESYLELDKLVDLLQKNETIHIEIGGHTDSRGDNEENLTLSFNRAKAVYDYAVAKNVSKERLTYKGYGSSKAVHTDDSINALSENKAKEAAHQENRRTEYKIIKKK